MAKITYTDGVSDSWMNWIEVSNIDQIDTIQGNGVGEQAVPLLEGNVYYSGRDLSMTQVRGYDNYNNTGGGDGVLATNDWFPNDGIDDKLEFSDDQGSEYVPDIVVRADANVIYIDAAGNTRVVAGVKLEVIQVEMEDGSFRTFLSPVSSDSLDNLGEISSIEITKVYDSDDKLLYSNRSIEGTTVCFAEGTLIQTADGEIKVEDLAIGDMVLSADGKQLRVKWIGRQTVSNTAAIMNPPVMIHKDALGEGKPHSNLHVTAAHGMYIDGLVINAGALVNNDTIAFMSWNQLPKTVTYYHIETENHEVIVANGAETESYVDYISRQRFDNYAEYVALYGIETRIVEMPRHRISSRRLVPMAVRERLGIQDMTPVSKSA